MSEPVVHYSVLVPVYNSEKTIQELWRRIQGVFSHITEDYEVVMVDDGSRDGVWRLMKEIAGKDRRAKVIRLSRNFGQQNAVLCGLKFCRGEFVITLDDDLQDPPEEISKLIEAIQKDPDADVVCGKSHGSSRSFLRNFFGFFYHTVQNFVFKSRLGLRVSSFKIFRKSVVQEILKNRSKNPLVGDILLEITSHIKNIELRRDPRGSGRSGYTSRKLIIQSLDMVLNRSDLPLQWISVLGFSSAFISLGMIFFYLTRYFFAGIGVSGWTTLVIINLFFPGMILFSFGVMGQYLVRIIREVNYAPQYVIRDTGGLD